LHPLDADVVRSYLCDDAAGPIARARWDPVLALLGTEAPAGQALGTPLMVGLARTIYNPRPGELVGTLRDPVELCGQPGKEAVESLLFEAFIPAAYRHDSAGRWKAQDAERWLVFLARHLEQTIGAPDLAWWQLRKTAPLTLLGERWKSMLGVAKVPARGVGIRVGGLVTGLVTGLAYGLVLSLVVGHSGGFGPALVIGLVSGLLFGLMFGLGGVPGDLAAVTSPGLELWVRETEQESHVFKPRA
jgi:hypothetical protein